MPKRILGLGRCIIGNLRKSLLKLQPNLISEFDHHYLLNYRSLLDTEGLNEEELELIDGCNLTPSMAEQISALDQINQFDLILIEIFPPSILYQKSTQAIFCSVENASACFIKQGFTPVSNYLKPKDRICDFPNVLKMLVKRIRANAPELPIVLLSGEYYSSERELGHPSFPDLVQSVVEFVEQTTRCFFFSMVDCLEELSAQSLAFRDTEFMLPYISRDTSSTPAQVRLDCKHASENLRDIFALQVLCGLKWLNETEFEKIKLQAYSVQPKQYRARAMKLMAEFNSNLTTEIQDARYFARFIEYASALNVDVDEHIQLFIAEKFSQPISEIVLKQDFYFLRTFCAYTFHNPRRENMEALISILSAIIEFALDSRPTDIRFLLLWTENILLALNAAYSNCRMSVDVQAQYIKLRNELSLADFVMCSSYIPQLLRNAC